VPPLATTENCTVNGAGPEVGFADAVAVKGDCSCAATCGTLGIYCRKMVTISKKDSKRTTAFFITKPTLYYFFSLLTFLAGWADEIWRFEIKRQGI
jgi:hypothetical protein